MQDFVPQNEYIGRERVSALRRKAFYNKKNLFFKDLEFFENRFFLFTKDKFYMPKTASRFGTGDPSPTDNLPKIWGLQRADMESAPTIFVFHNEYTEQR